MKKFFIFSLVSCLLILATTSCRNSYPCPGAGQSTSADLSAFDEKGNPKGKKRKKFNDNGLVNKKNPKRIRANR